MATTLESIFRKTGEMVDFTPAAAIAGGQVIQLPDGRAAVAGQDIAASVQGAVRVSGLVDVLKAASVVIVNGARIWWDHSANAATPVPQFADRDFYLGCAVADYAAGVTYIRVALNVQPPAIIDPIGGGVGPNGGDTVPVLTAGTPYLINRGGMMEAGFSATAEAQKEDWLSCRSFPVGSNWILEALVEITTNADADVADLNIGVANGTHASDADSITESCFVHFDMGADLNIDAESDDGTTEVAATDTTIDWATNAPVFICLDGRDHTDIQIYINGVLVLGSTTFTLAAATGPLKALFHLEKSANDSPGVVQLHDLRVRICE